LALRVSKKRGYRKLRLIWPGAGGLLWTFRERIKKGDTHLACPRVATVEVDSFVG
jgi:hypothetical protein